MQGNIRIANKFLCYPVFFSYLNTFCSLVTLSSSSLFCLFCQFVYLLDDIGINALHT